MNDIKPQKIELDEKELKGIAEKNKPDKINKEIINIGGKNE